MYDFLNIKHSLVLINLIVIEDVSPHCILHLNTSMSNWAQTTIVWSLCSIIIWETFIEGGCKAWCTIWSVWVSSWSSGGFGGSSSDHHWDGNVIVVTSVFGFVSILSSDGVEGIISDNLSEWFKSNWVNFIKSIGWWNLKSKCSLLINWNVNDLGVGLKDFGIGLSANSDCSHCEGN